MVYRTQSLQNTTDEAFTTALKNNPVSLIMAIYAFLALWFVVGLWVFHTYLALTEQTTYEQLKKVWKNDSGNPFAKQNHFKNIFKLCRLNIRESFLEYRKVITVDYNRELSTNVKKESSGKTLSSRSKENDTEENVRDNQTLKQLKIFPGEIYEDDEMEETSIYDRHVQSDMRIDNDDNQQMGSRVNNRFNQSHSLHNNFGKDSTFEDAKKNPEGGFDKADVSKLSGIPVYKTEDKPSSDFSMHGMSKMMGSKQIHFVNNQQKETKYAAEESGDQNQTKKDIYTSMIYDQYK